jgi:hypothetical protein
MNELTQKSGLIAVMRVRSISSEGIITKTACDVTKFCSDTLKRHQKLHVPEGQKAPKRTSKSSKRNRAGTVSDANGFDRPTESSMDQSPVQEVTEPQFFYYSLEAWEYPPLTSPPVDIAVSHVGIDEAGRYFEGNYTTMDGDSVGSAGSDLTVNPEYLWDSL